MFLKFTTLFLFCFVKNKEKEREKICSHINNLILGIYYQDS